MTTDKPLGRKAYGHIGHLPGSRVGPGDHTVNDGQARICLEAPHPNRRSDVVTVTEKLDGTCVAVALLDGKLVPLVRAGYPAATSPYEQHHLFADWVWEHEDDFRNSLKPGQRLVGEWLAQAHGTRYDLNGHPPFVAFDLMEGDLRLLRSDLTAACCGLFATTQLLHEGGPIPLGDALAELGDHGFYGADRAEGVVYRVESELRGARYCDFLAKYVHPDKQDGCLLPGVNPAIQEPIWNWRPETTQTTTPCPKCGGTGEIVSMVLQGDTEDDLARVEFPCPACGVIQKTAEVAARG